MEYKALLIESDGPVDWVTLNRPERLNALNGQLVDELLAYFGDLYTNRDTRIVVLRGAGRAFCAGLDLKDNAPTRESGSGGNSDGGKSRGPNPSAGMFDQRHFSEIILRMRRCPQPIIALIHGPAAGAGFSLSLAADVRLAGESARMNAAFIRIGFSGGDCGSSFHLPRLVGGTNAAEILMTGRFVDAERALRIGLVSDVVPDDVLESAGRALAGDMVKTGPLGLRLTKDLLNASASGLSLEQAISLEDRSQVLCSASGDPAEGARAFVEKRDPVYRT